MSHAQQENNGNFNSTAELLLPDEEEYFFIRFALRMPRDERKKGFHDLYMPESTFELRNVGNTVTNLHTAGSNKQQKDQGINVGLRSAVFLLLNSKVLMNYAWK